MTATRDIFGDTFDSLNFLSSFSLSRVLAFSQKFRSRDTFYLHPVYGEEDMVDERYKQGSPGMYVA